VRNSAESAHQPLSRPPLSSASPMTAPASPQRGPRPGDRARLRAPAIRHAVPAGEAGGGVSAAVPSAGGRWRGRRGPR